MEGLLQDRNLCVQIVKNVTKEEGIEWLILGKDIKALIRSKKESGIFS